MSTCAEVAQRLNYWPPNRLILEGRGFESRRQLFFFFFFFNIHNSDKLEIFFGGRVFSEPGRHFVYHGESLMHWSAAL